MLYTKTQENNEEICKCILRWYVYNICILDLRKSDQCSTQGTGSNHTMKALTRYGSFC